MIAYARALQHFAKQNNLPERNKQCLLAESVMELRREEEFYLPFTDEEVFTGVDLPKDESRSMVPASANITTTTISEVQPTSNPMLERDAPKV